MSGDQGVSLTHSQVVAFSFLLDWAEDRGYPAIRSLRGALRINHEDKTEET